MITYISNNIIYTAAVYKYYVLLTLFLAVMSAPFITSISAVAVLPYSAARCRGVLPYYINNKQQIDK